MACPRAACSTWASVIVSPFTVAAVVSAATPQPLNVSAPTATQAVSVRTRAGGLISDMVRGVPGMQGMVRPRW